MLVTKKTKTLDYGNILYGGIVIKENLPTKKEDIYTVDVLLLHNDQYIEHVPVLLGQKTKTCYDFTRLYPATKTFVEGNEQELSSIPEPTIMHYIYSDGTRVLVDMFSNHRNTPIIVGNFQSSNIDITFEIEGSQQLLSVSNVTLEEVEQLSWCNGNLIVFGRNSDVIYEKRDLNDIHKKLWRLDFINNAITLYRGDDDNNEKYIELLINDKLTIYNKAGVKLVEVNCADNSTNLGFEPAVLGDTLAGILKDIKDEFTKLGVNTYNSHTHTAPGGSTGVPNSLYTTSLTYDENSVKSDNVKISQ